jgi:DNA-binding MarR family transcriptional regulator
MKTQDLRTLRLLEAVEAGEAPNQRELAHKLDVSLGLANTFVRNLTKEGYVQVVATGKKKVKYRLTSKGLREKSRLTCEYIDYSMGFYRKIKSLLQALFSRLETEGVKRLAFYGRGELAEVACLLLADFTIGLAGIYDDNAEAKSFCGHRVNHTKDLATTTLDYVLITRTDNIGKHRQRLLRSGIAPERVLHFGDDGLPTASNAHLRVDRQGDTETDTGK